MHDPGITIENNYGVNRDHGIAKMISLHYCKIDLHYAMHYCNVI